MRCVYFCNELNIKIRFVMSTTSTKSNKNSTKIKSFGIPFECGDVSRQDFMELMARLFINPQVSPEHAKHYIKQLKNGSMSINRLLELADKGVQDVLFKRSLGTNISDLTDKKIREWIEVLGEPSVADWNYLIKNYQLDYDDLAAVDEGRQESQKPVFHSPKEMASYVKQFVICQDEAIDAIAVPIFQQHECRSRKQSSKICSSVVLIGRTGSGKSEICHQFQRICGCPVIYVNTSEVVPTAWRGRHITDVFAQAIKDGVSIDDLKYSILVLDEFDKVVHYNQRKVGHNTDFDADMMRDVMRLFESGQLFLEDGMDKDLSPKGYSLPMDNILVVFAGAFCGIEDIVRKRLQRNKERALPQSSASVQGTNELLKKVRTEDLIEWGFMPELIGRIGNTCVLNTLTSDMIFEIITKSKDNILQTHVEYCRQHNVDLNFTTEALRLIADLAFDSGLGFRNVKSMLSQLMNPIYYQLGDKAKKKKQVVNIDTAYVFNRLGR